MQIANPIYDTVFKYMMNDSKVAKLLLSGIIGEKIVELNFQSKDQTYNKKTKKESKKPEIGFYYMDFNAKIETASGEYKTVIIELQKEKRITDIVRFRQYLGTMYQSTENTYDEELTKARRIYCVYFLNYDIGLAKCPVIKVDQKISNLITGKELHGKSDFIEGLNHLSWIVQIKHIRKIKNLKEKHLEELENVLKIFDQDNQINQHILEINEKDFPEKYRPVIRKLQEACATPEVLQQMRAEDLLATENAIKDKMIAQQKEELSKKDQELAQKDEELAKLKKELETLKKR